MIRGLRLPARAFALVAVGSLAAAGLALAGSVGVSTAPLGNGDAIVAECDPGGFTHGYTTFGGAVTSVTVGAIADPACENGTLRVTVTDASGAAIAAAGPQVIAADAGTVDNSATLSTSPQPSAALVAGIHIVVEGP
jgi:hypothetical protein